jgi:hypothetical protein
MYSDLESINFDKYPFNKIFIIAKGGTDKPLKNRKERFIKIKIDEDE